MTLPCAEDLNYWKSSGSTPDTWLDRAEKIINDLGGEVFIRAIAKRRGLKVFIMEFSFEADDFKAIWPVLPVKNERDEKAAERQAATMLFHDVKGRAVRFVIFGARVAFFDYLMLPDGRTAAELGNSELTVHAPKLLN